MRKKLRKVIFEIKTKIIKRKLCVLLDKTRILESVVICIHRAYLNSFPYKYTYMRVSPSYPVQPVQPSHPLRQILSRDIPKKSSQSVFWENLRPR